MREQIKLAAFVVLVCLAVVLLLALMSDYASGGDYTVTRGTTIESQRPIWLLVVEAGMGVLNGRVATERAADSGITGGWADKIGTAGGVELHSTTLRVDGVEQPGRTSFLAAWRLAGFLLWDADGRIERVTDLQFRGRQVRIVDAVSDGRVRVRVTIGPPLGDPRVRYAVLELEATDDEREDLADLHGRPLGGTCIRISCSAVIDLPCDRRRERVHARRQRWGCDGPTLSEGIAADEAGPELSGRVGGLAEAGRLAVLDGRGRLTDSVVAEFLERVCR